MDRRRTDPARAAGALAVVVAVAALSAGASNAQVAGEESFLWERATTAADADSAADYLERMISAHPRTTYARRARLALGDLHFARGDFAAARTHYRRAADRWEGADRATLGMARCYYALGDYPEARRLARPLTRVEGPAVGWSAAFLVAKSWQSEQLAEEALEAYRRLFARGSGPNVAAALASAISLAERAGEREEAAEWSDRLLRRFPESPEAVRLRGRRESDAPAAEPGP